MIVILRVPKFEQIIWVRIHYYLSSSMESLRALLDLSFSRSRLLVKSFSFTTGKLIVMDYGLGILRLLQLLALD